MAEKTLNNRISIITKLSIDSKHIGEYEHSIIITKDEMSSHAELSSILRKSLAGTLKYHHGMENIRFVWSLNIKGKEIGTFVSSSSTTEYKDYFKAEAIGNYITGYEKIYINKKG